MTAHYIRSLDVAAKQFKLAWQVGSATNIAMIPGNDPFPQPMIGGTYGQFSIGAADIKLSPDDAAIAGSALLHCATFTLAVAVDSALEQIIPNRFDSPIDGVPVASRIARIIRNAFTHDPFFPRWNCTNPNHIGVFDIEDVITLDTTDLNDCEVEWQHYGGRLALLKFLRHCQGLLMAQTDAA